jgi:hypothetical protein
VDWLPQPEVEGDQQDGQPKVGLLLPAAAHADTQGLIESPVKVIVPYSCPILYRFYEVSSSSNETT